MNNHEKNFAIFAYNKIKTNIQFSKFWWNENIKIYKRLYDLKLYKKKKCGKNIIFQILESF